LEEFNIDKEEQEAEKLSKMGNCYWYDKKDCETCEDRFKCHTTRIKVFEITLALTGYETYRVCATDVEQAKELFDKYFENEAIVEQYSEGHIDKDYDGIREIKVKSKRLTPQRKSGKIKE